LHPDFFGTWNGRAYAGGYAQQSGQSYVTRPPWNVCGVDYACGAPSTTGLKDPAAEAATLPSGCSYGATSSVNGGPQVTCGRGGAAAVFDGWDFTGRSGDEGCVLLVVTPRYNFTTFTLKRSRIGGAGANCAGRSVQGYVKIQSWNSSITNVVWYANTCAGPADPASYRYETNCARFYNGGTLTSSYSAFIAIAGRPFAGASNTVVSSQDYFEGFTYQANQGHGEIYEPIFVPHATGGITGTTLTLSAVNSAPPFSLTVGSRLGGIDNGTYLPITPGTIVSATGPNTLPCTGDVCVGGYTVRPSQAVTSGTNISTPATAPLQQYSYDTCMLPAASGSRLATSCIYFSTGSVGAGAGTLTRAQADHNVLVANLSGGLSIASYAIELSYISYTNVSISTNYLDLTGFGTTGAGNKAYAVLEPETTCANRAVLTGNISMLDGTSRNAWTTNVGTGC
jgi:hypothetical protein